MDRPKDTLVKWRKDRGLSQTDAGRLLRPRVSQAAWGAWESGAKPPSLHNAFELERLTDGEIEAAQWSKPRRARRKTEERAA
jgi:DNA-binding XRE family transcriptional regulator